MRTMKHWALAAMAATALALAGCGGGGSSSTVTTPTQTSSTPAELATAADMALTEAKTLVDGLTDESTDAQVKAAEDKVKAAETAVGAASEADNHAALSKRLGDLEGSLREKKTSRTTAMNAADEATKTAAAKDALALFNGFADAGEDAAADLALGTIAVTDKHGGSASVTADGAGGTPAVKATDTMVSMLGRWKGTELAGDTDGEMPSNTVVVYTDIEAPKAVPFGDVHTLTGDVLTIDADADADAHVALISASAFTHAGRVNHDPDPDSAADIVRVRGMFNGAAGEYRCTAATAETCGSIESSKGVRLTTGWVFDPDSGAMAMQADANYLYFGWWLHKAGGTATPEVMVFHNVTGTLAAPTDISALGGTATYEGAAAGQYAINPGLSSASGGHWTADATLTAEWGSETVAGMISGMVDGFMAGGEEMNWSVKLGKTTLGTTGTFDSATGDPATGDGVVWTIDGVAGAESGAWSGALLVEGDNGVPTMGHGEFSATHGAVGHILGAFGVHVEE